MRRVLPLGLSLLLLAGCGSSGSSGPSGAPVISNLRVVPLTALVPGRVATLTLFVDYVDAQGDVFGGRVLFKRADGTIARDSTITLATPGTHTNATSGTIFSTVRGTYSATPVTVRLAIVDIRGNESNVLTVLTLLEHPTPA